MQGQGEPAPNHLKTCRGWLRDYHLAASVCLRLPCAGQICVCPACLFQVVPATNKPT